MLFRSDVVVCISFQNDAEALKLLTIVSAQPLGKELHPYIEFKQGQGLELNLKDYQEEAWLRVLSDAFYRFLLEEKLLQAIKHQVMHKYFFREKEEIEAILEVASSLLEEEQIKGYGFFVDEKYMIREGLQTILAEGRSFSFDSFMMFRIKTFQQSLQSFTMKAIDEYKLEQDYQSFIASLRDFLRKREPKMAKLHLVYHDAFYFYDSSFRKLERYEISDHIDKRLLSESAVYIDSVTLAPLLSIAPENLYIYTDDTEQGLIQTVKRVFEERSQIFPLASFTR